MGDLYIFGDSVMKGILQKEGRYALRTDASGNHLLSLGFEKVHNLAKMGATIPFVYQTIGRFSARIRPCDTILVGCGGNDSDFDWSQVAADPSGLHEPKVSLSAFLDIYRDCLTLCHSRTRRVFLTNLVPIDAGKYMETIARDNDEGALRSWLGDEQTLYRWHENYSRCLEALARENNVTLIDVRSRFLVSHRYFFLFGPDGIHPTEEGYALLDEALRESLPTEKTSSAPCYFPAVFPSAVL